MDARIHLHLRTTDLLAARGFYEKLLGAPDKVREDLIRFQPDGLALSLTLMPGTPPPIGPEEHFGIKWATAEANQAAWARIASAGLESAYDEQEVSCCAAVQTKRWFVDPDGRPWEVYVVLDDSDAVPTFPAKPAQSLAGVAGGCCGTKPAANAEVDASGGCCA